MDEQGSDYVLKYAGGISLYYQKKKIGAIQYSLESKENILNQNIKHPKHDNAPLILLNPVLNLIIKERLESR